MMHKWLFSVAVSLALAIPFAVAQGRQGAGMQGQRRGGTMGQQGQAGPKDMGPQFGQQQRQRMQAHATQQQRDQYRQCTQSMERVRSQVREMRKAANGKAMDKQQVQQLQNRLRSEMQTMRQERERLSSSLNQDQTATVQNQLAEVERNQQRLEEFSESLGLELDQADMDRDRVRDQLRDMDKTSKGLQDQQRLLGENLAVD